jgi:hypothetical protein
VGGGPASVVTDKGVFRFDLKTHEIYLAEVFPWQDEAEIEQLKKSFSWDLKIADNLKILQPPTEKEMTALKLMDPGGQYIIASIMDRPIGKLILAGNIGLEGCCIMCEIGEKAITEVLEFVT